MGYLLGGLVSHVYCHCRHKLQPGPLVLDVTLALGDSLHDLPLLALGEEAWIVNPARRRLPLARAPLPHLRVKAWHL